MNDKININQVEKLTGVSKRNIRFYEEEGLLLPERNNENGYRVYGKEDIWRIKVIKILRMLNMPLEEIKKVLKEEQLLSKAIVKQQAELEQKAQELQSAILFCSQLKETELDSLDVDHCLDDIERTDPNGFFKDWMDDYKKVLKANEDMDFTFIPDSAITNAKEFTDALFHYANKENIDIIITKESMYPEFTINGVEYIAERNYTPIQHVPVAVVSCHRKDRGVKGNNVDESRKNFQWFLHNWGIFIVLFIIYMLFMIPVFVKTGFTPETVVTFISSVAVFGSLLYRHKLLHFNDKTK